MLYQTVHQAHLRGAHTLHLGMDAEVEKSRYGTTAHKAKVYVQSRELPRRLIS
jgi:hypothetical protein